MAGLLIKLAGYFAAGVVGDYLISRYYLAISHRRVYEASSLAFAITMFSVLVIATLVVERNFWLMLAYALGTGAGTFSGLMR